VNEFTWIDIVNRAYDMHAGCLDAVGDKATGLIRRLGASAAGRARLRAAFHLCAGPSGGPSGQSSGADPGPFPATAAEVGELADWWTDAVETMPQANYPYPVPPFTEYGWPVNVTCARLTNATMGGVGVDGGGGAGGDDAALLAAMAAVAGDFYGYDGSACLDGRGQGGIPGGGAAPNMLLDPTDTAWGYQSCTETLHAFSGRGVRNFSYADNYEAGVVAPCREAFGVAPDQTNWADVHFGGWAIGEGRTGLSNVIFSQGLLDPWHGGGFLDPWDNASCPVLLMKNGAHHLDLRGPHAADPPDVTATRAEEQRVIKGWIDDYVAEDVQRQQLRMSKGRQ